MRTPPIRGLFITGTDTGVGKTWVTAALARLLRRQGERVRVCKPVATGAAWVAGRWLAEDTRLLAEAAGDNPEAVTAWTFPEPAAPPVAARLAGATLSLEAIAAAVRCRTAEGGFVLVEGVGGLLCPLTERETVADLAASLGLPLVVVARRSLGTLNHTLLTLEAAQARRLRVAGVVVSETTLVGGVAEETNVAELQCRLSVPVLAVVSHRPTSEPDEAPELAAVDWRHLADTCP